MENASSAMKKSQAYGNKKFLPAIILIFSLQIVSANISINEIMYDLNGTDTGHEWIEIYNNGSESINLSGWKFYEGATNHGLILINGSWILENNTYAIIADDSATFLADFLQFNASLFDSSFDLSNSGENLSLKNSTLSIVESVFYNSSWGASGNNKSLQLFNNSWCEGIPTPGAASNCTIFQNNQGNSTNETENNTEKSAGKMSYEIEYPEIINVSENFTVKIIAKNSQNHSQIIYAWSYVYKNNKCLSCDENNDRESNKIEIEIDSEEEEEIFLQNSAEAENGTYNLKIKILKEELKTPKEYTFNITVLNFSSKIEEKKIEKAVIAQNLSNNSSNCTALESKSERDKKLAFYLLSFTLLMIIILQHRKDLNKL
jgi:hypothetical protein